MRVKMWHVFNFLPCLSPPLPLRHGLSVSPSSMRDTNSNSEDPEDDDDHDDDVDNTVPSFIPSMRGATLHLALAAVRPEVRRAAIPP